MYKYTIAGKLVTKCTVFSGSAWLVRKFKWPFHLLALKPHIGSGSAGHTYCWALLLDPACPHTGRADHICCRDALSLGFSQVTTCVSRDLGDLPDMFWPERRHSSISWCCANTEQPEQRSAQKHMCFILCYIFMWPHVLPFCFSRYWSVKCLVCHSFFCTVSTNL